MLDMRDLAERMRELEEREAIARIATTEPLDQEVISEEDFELDEDEIEELEELRRFVRDELAYAKGTSDDLRDYAKNEPTMIAEHEFEDYARDLAQDIGAISGDEGWPMSYIDWERAAEALQADYSTMTYDGTDYYVRSY